MDWSPFSTFTRSINFHLLSLHYHFFKAKKLILTHLVPTKFDEKKLNKTVRIDFGKNPIIGKDLLKIRI